MGMHRYTGDAVPEKGPAMHWPLFLFSLLLFSVETSAPVLVHAVSHCTPNRVPYDIVYVRAPRFGAATDTTWPEVTRPLNADPGSELHLLHPDCRDELLFPLPQHQSSVDAPIGNGVVLARDSYRESDTPCRRSRRRSPAGLYQRRGEQ